MSELTKQERTAVEAVARRFSAIWEKGSDPSEVFFVVAGKRVAVDVATLKRRSAGHDNAAKPHLRFDKVVVKLMDGLKAALDENVPNGTTVLLTVTAPIRLPSKTAASLEHKILALLGQGSREQDEKDTVHGNRVRIRLWRGGSDRAPKMIGFVHNPDTDPLLLLNMTCELLEVVSAEAGDRTPSEQIDRWLVVISAGGISCLEAYRIVYSQLRIATEFKKVLMVYADGRVGVLAE